MSSQNRVDNVHLVKRPPTHGAIIDLGSVQSTQNPLQILLVVLAIPFSRFFQCPFHSCSLSSPSHCLSKLCSFQLFLSRPVQQTGRERERVGKWRALWFCSERPLPATCSGGHDHLPSLALTCRHSSGCKWLRFWKSKPCNWRPQRNSGLPRICRCPNWWMPYYIDVLLDSIQNAAWEGPRGSSFLLPSQDQQRALDGGPAAVVGLQEKRQISRWKSLTHPNCYHTNQWFLYILHTSSACSSWQGLKGP